MRALPTRVLSVAAVLALTGACSSASGGSGDDEPAQRSPAPSSSSSSSTTEAVATVSGYPVGQFPPIPLITVPDVTALTQSQQSVSADLQATLGAIPGLEVTAARCDADGVVVNSAGTLVLYGDGSGVVTGQGTGGDGSTVNHGDGAGVSTVDGVTVVNYGDGAGTYSDGTTAITVYGDGTGTYSDGVRSVTLFPGGGGTYADGDVANTNNGDGSATYADGIRTITNYGDGSAVYAQDGLSIQNHGDGTGLVNGLPVEVEPVPPVGKVGSFPDVEALAPIGNVCGTLIRLPGDVLFDFDDDAVRADAAPVLQVVADALNGAGTTGATQGVRVEGHTDGFGSDEYNQDLSQRRAQSVLTWLTGHGVASSLTAEGFGETRPIAPETVDGHDDPAGRQLNRRVEFVLPGS